jgi:putative peptide zinc metalloprotease protein
VGGAYRFLFRPLFTRGGQVLLLVVAIAGATAFLVETLGGSVTSPPAGLVIGSFVALAIQGLSHELAHAVTTKHFGREVHRAGVGWYLFMPVAFVDTSDIWLAPPRQRATASLAGPYTNAVLAGLAAMLLLVVDEPFWRLFLVQLATTGYLLAVVNLNPLIELDGYYALIDAVDIPNLRDNALAFIGALLWRRPRTTRDPVRARMFGAYGVLSLAYTAFVALTVLGAYQHFIQVALAPVLPDVFSASLGWALAALLSGLILSNLWRGLRATC